MRVDVAVLGDGPAGSAIAAALRRRDVSSVLVGRDDPWTATYGTWLDGVPSDLSDRPGVWISVSDPVDVVVDGAGERNLRRPLTRAYGVFDNARLQQILRGGVEHLRASIGGVDGVRGRLSVRLDGDAEVEARLVVDATGWPASVGGDVPPDPRAWQTAFGVVLDSRPSGPLGRSTLMDWSAPPRPVAGAPATFLYALPVADGWLLEETVLASRDAVDPDELVEPLASRLGTSGGDLLARASRIERVRIPMGTPAIGVSDDGRIPFGAAAGSGHPATGYSVADSLSSADRVADAIVGVVRESTIDDDAIATLDRAVWPRPRLRTRALHDYGLDVLLSLSPDETRRFFATFFELDDRRWPAYLDGGTSPRSLSSTMSAMFLRAPWALRRRMVRPRELLGTASSVGRPAPIRSPRTPRR